VSAFFAKLSTCCLFWVHLKRSRTFYIFSKRAIVSIISTKMQPFLPLFLVGYGLGGYLISKYLGEECRCKTLNKHFQGGVGIMAPMQLTQVIPINEDKSLTKENNSTISDSFKDALYRQWSGYSQFQCKQFQTAFRKAIDPKSTIKDVYAYMYPYLSRNKIDNFDYSIVTAIGYNDIDHLLQEGCSLDFIPHISIPFLFIIDKGHPVSNSNNCNYYYAAAASNPNIFLIETELVEHRKNDYPSRKTCVTTSNFVNDTAAAFAKAIVTLRQELWFSNDNFTSENRLYSKL
jgi:predicted alpha/beta-fold hydrolase